MEEKEVIKVGDLVETCQMLPGFVTEVDGDSCSVFIPGKHEFWAGGHHSIIHCGVHKISNEYAMKLFGIGEERLSEIYRDETRKLMDWEDVVDAEYRYIKANTKYKPKEFREAIDDKIKYYGYDADVNLALCVTELEKILEDYKGRLQKSQER